MITKQSELTKGILHRRNERTAPHLLFVSLDLLVARSLDSLRLLLGPGVIELHDDDNMSKYQIRERKHAKQPVNTLNNGKHPK